MATTASYVEICTSEDLQTYEMAWRTLFEHSSQPSVFASWEWFIHWWRYFGTFNKSHDKRKSGHITLIKIHSTEGDLVGLIPLYNAIQAVGATRIPVLRMVGFLEAGMENPTEEPIALLKAGYEREAILAAQTLLRREPRNSDWSYASLGLPHLSTDRDADSSSLDSGRWIEGIILRRKTMTAELLPFPDTWEAFRASLSKSMRDNIKYYPRLIRRHGHTSEIKVARTPDEVSAAASVLTVLHHRRNASSYGVPHADHLPTDAHRRFLRDCLTALAERKMASIFTLEINGMPVASQAVLEDPDGICLYYSGFEPDWQRYSPITILATEIFQEAIERGIRRANLLHYSLPWKSRWGAHSVARYDRTICVRRHLPSLVRCAALHVSNVLSNYAPVPAKDTQLMPSCTYELPN